MSTESKPDVSAGTPWTQPNGIYHKYGVHCHCGTLRLTMNLSPPLYEEHAQGQGTAVALECACSWCERHGFLSVHPLLDDVTWTHGYEERGVYLLGSKQNPQIFCKKCGSAVATDVREVMKLMGQEPRWSINVRMLEDYDPKKLETRREETMKNMPPKYQLQD